MGIEKFIDNEVKANDVVLFMKGTPQFPQCGFSGQVVQILDYLGVAYKGVNVLESDELREGIKAYSNWPTIPQLYVKGEFVGGCDIVREMFQAGELQQAFKEKGVPVKAGRADLAVRPPRKRAACASGRRALAARYPQQNRWFSPCAARPVRRRAPFGPPQDQIMIASTMHDAEQCRSFRRRRTWSRCRRPLT